MHHSSFIHNEKLSGNYIHELIVDGAFSSCRKFDMTDAFDIEEEDDMMDAFDIEEDDITDVFDIFDTKEDEIFTRMVD